MSDHHGPMIEVHEGLEVASPRFQDKYSVSHSPSPAPQSHSLLGHAPQHHHHQHRYGSPTSHPSTSAHTPSQHQYATPLPPAFTPGGHQQDEQQQQYGKQSRGGAVPCGMPVWLFALVAALLGFVIGAAIVGGVLGSRVAELSRQSESATATTATTQTPNPTTSAGSNPSPRPTQGADVNNFTVALRPSQVNGLALDCPALHRTNQASFNNRRFSLECGVDNLGEGREASGTSIVDITTIYAYSFSDCLDACASYNRGGANFPGRPSVLTCRSVSFRRDMNGGVSTENGGNCFLKNATRADGNAGFPNVDILTAQLI